MLDFSTRAANLLDSPIRRLSAISDAVKKQGVSVYHLNIGQPDIPTPKTFLETIRTADIPVVKYSPSDGELFLKKQVALQYNHLYQTDLNEEHVLVTCGSSEGLLFAFFVCTDQGDEILVLDPCYTNYIGYAEMIGTRLTCVSSHIEEGYCLPPIAHFEEKITSKTKAILLCNPNNPTGYLYTPEELHAIGDLCEKHNLFLIVDEAYRELCYQGTPSTALQSLQHLSHRIVVLDTVSKQFSATGARIGFMVTKNKTFLSQVLKLAHMRLSPPYIDQLGAKALLELPSTYYEEVRAIYKSRRDTALRELKKIKGMVCPQPEGAFYIACRLPVKDASHFCKWMLESFQKDKKTVMLTPMSGFYQDKHMGADQVRLAYVLQEKELVDAIDCMRLALEEYGESK